ncbi:MAG: hypothetical protein HOQ10_10280 [Frateuria sp.]|nr:hypothetical protein [Frateuria sp.]
MKNTSSWLVTATCLALPLAAVAQASPAGPAPALRYESAFADYKPWEAIQPGDWRTINDALTRQADAHGGHAAPPAAGSPASPPPKAAGSPPATVPGHDAHHMHGGQK